MRVAILTTDSREHYRDYGNPRPYFGTAPAALLEGFQQTPEVEIHVISCLQQAPVSSPERLAGNIFYHGLVVPKWGWLRSGYAGCVRAVGRVLREIRPDLVHGQGTERDCAFAAVRSGLRNLITIHGNMRRLARIAGAKPFSYLWFAARLEGWTVARTDGVVCITEHTRREVARLARRTWVVPNAVDPTFFEVRREPQAEPLILCVANVSPVKNQLQFIRALDALASRHRFKALFLGQAPATEPYAAEFLDEVRQRPWCEYGGFADRATLRQRLAQSAFTALPSLEDNCPMVVLESMAAGVPVMAARVGGVPDLVEDNVTGLLFDPRDGSGMTAAAGRLLEDPPGAAALAERARAAARERFHPARIARQHVEIYQDLLKTEA
jgi:glycosyltransferase involved in cell wall biosynthesis